MNNIKFYNKGKEVLSFEKAVGYMLGSNSIAVQVDDKNVELFNLSSYERISIENLVEEVKADIPDNVVTIH